MTSDTATPTRSAVAAKLQGRRVGWGEAAFQAATLIGLLLSLGVLVALLADIIAGAWSVVTTRGADFVSAPISLSAETAGVMNGIIGSVLLTLVVAIVAIPLGMAAAVYLEEYAKDTRPTRFIQTNVRNLAGVPSIVYGLLGLGVIVRLVTALGAGGSTNGRNVIAGGLTLAVLVLPIVVITTSEALRAVPAGIREAAYGVGATQWEVTRHQVLPAALPAILTGTVLTLARAFGETAPLLLVGAATGFFATGGQGLMGQLTGTYTALPVVVYSWSRQPDGAFRNELAPAAILVLLVLLLAANAAAIIIRNRNERKW